MIGENEDELWNVYDKDRNLTDKVQRRGDPLAADEYHLVVHVCIFNSRHELLMQKRQPWKKGWPDMWDLSVGGSAVLGDDSRKAAERETREELGLEIDLKEERPRFTVNFKSGFDDFWMIEKDIRITDLNLQPEEVADAKWVTREQYNKMRRNGVAVPYFFGDIIFDLKYNEGVIDVR